MLASKKEEESGGYAKQRQAQGRGRKVNFPHQQAPAPEKHGGNPSNPETREAPGADKKGAKPKKAGAAPPPAAGNRIRGAAAATPPKQAAAVAPPKQAAVAAPPKQAAAPPKQAAAAAAAAVAAAPVPPPSPPQSSINKYRTQIKKFIQNIEEYRTLENSLKFTHDTLQSMRKELLDSEVEPEDVPDVQSSLQDMIHGILSPESKTEDQSRLIMVEKECSEIKVAFTAIEEEKRKLEETLDMMNHKLRCKEEELIKVIENERVLKAPVFGEGDIEEMENLKKTITKLDQENSDLAEKLKRFDDDKSEGGKDDQKIKSLEKLIETLHVDIKQLKDQLKIEKEGRSKLEGENEKLRIEVDELKNLGSSSESKYIILEKDNKIQDLQNRLNEISRIRPHQSSGAAEVFKVDFSADAPSLVNQLAKFVQLYEELSREGFDLEFKLKDAHMEIYRLEQILEKQLTKIKEQDDCLKNMEQSLSKVVVETRKTSRVDQSSGQPIPCKCEEMETLIKEKEEFSEKLKEKMSLLYQKYKQYKSECNMMRKKLDAFEKRSWLKKLVNI